MAAVVFLVAAGAWGAMQAMAAVSDGQPAHVEPSAAAEIAGKSDRKVRGPQDKLDFVNYRRTWRTYYA